MPLGHITIAWENADDGSLRERRTRTEAEVVCPGCFAAVELDAETFEWRLSTVDGKLAWKHTLYGPPIGECVPCALAFCDTGDRVEASSLKEAS